MEHHAQNLKSRYGAPRAVERSADIPDAAWEQIRRRITEALEAHPDAWELVARALAASPEVRHEDQ
jgi:hypothetical protein